MKKVSLILSLLGIFSLALIFFIQKPINVSSEKDLEKLIDNTKVKVSGFVKSEYLNDHTYTLILSNNIKLICKNCNSYKNKYIEAQGYLEDYLNKKKIIVSSINLK